MPYLLTSLLIGAGTVALAKLRPRGGGVLGMVLLIPGIVMAMGFYASGAQVLQWHDNGTAAARM